MKEGTIQHIFALDESQYNGSILDTKIEDIKERRIVYGYIEDVNNMFDRWENPARYSGGDETCTVKIGELDPTSEVYKGKLVKDAVNFRVQQQHSDSAMTEYIPVFCFASDIIKISKKADDDFRYYIRKYHTHLAKEDGELISGISKKNIKEFYNSYKTGIRDRSENFQMSTHQKECSDKIVTAYNSGITSFLLGAKPRFGKNFTLLETARILGLKNILFVSYLPTVFDSLEYDVESHINYKGWKYIDYRDKKNRGENPYDDITPTVVSVSAQLLNYTDDEDGLKNEFSIEDMNAFRESLNFVASSDIDIVVIDEAHFGGQTPYIDNITSFINAKMVVYVTGTDSNFKNDTRFNVENTYEYDYIDECFDTDPRAKKMPKIKVFTYELDKHLLLEGKREYKVSEFPTFKKLFVTKGLKFVHEDLVRLFFKTIFGVRQYEEGGLRSVRKINSISPFANEDIDNIDHTLAILPNINAVKASIKLLRKMNLDEFEFIDAAGDGYNKIEDIKNIIQTKKSQHKKTVTFVCKRFREGVTVPEWHGVFLFDDGKSFNEYIQTMFRVQSYELNKKFCYIFDYNPERCLKIRYEHIHYNHKPGYSEEQMEGILYDCMPIMYYDAEGNLVENMDFKNKMTAVMHTTSFRDGYDGFGMTHINESRWMFSDTKSLINSFEDVVIGSNGMVGHIDGQTNGIKGGVLKKRVEEIKKAIVSKDSKKVEKETEELIKLCIEVMKGIPEFLFVTGKEYKNIYSALKSENEEIFRIITNFEMDDFKMLLDERFIKADELNYSISKFNQDKKEMFDYALSSSCVIKDIDGAKELMEEFNRKWIYEKGSNRDVPFSVMDMYNF